MADRPRSARFQTLFESALEAYGKMTGIKLAQHPLFMELKNCNPVGSITAFLQSQAPASSDFTENDRLMGPIKVTVWILTTLSATASLDDAFNPTLSPANAIYTGLAILLAAAQKVTSSLDALIDLLKSIEHILHRLHVYTRISTTPAMHEIVVKIMVELLSLLALATKELERGQSIKSARRVLEERDIEAAVQRKDEPTHDDPLTAATQTLEVVLRLIQDMRVVMDEGNGSVSHIREALVVSDMNALECDKLQQDIQNWLSPPDPWKNYNIACRLRHIGTGTWLVRSNALSEWKASGSSSLLWIHGKPGSGKSVLCSTIIQEIDVMRKSGLASLAFYYYDFREDQKKDIRGLLSSVLVQLCDQSDAYHDILSNFYSTHRRDIQNPSDDELLRCLKHLLELPGQAPIYLIIDALDECPKTSAIPSPREEVLTLVEQLIESRVANLHVCVTSRPETDIKVILEPLTFRSISIHDESRQMQDIEYYIRSVVDTDPKNRRWKQEDKQLVIDHLTRYADGMFRWVYCQIVYLRGCHSGRIRHVLAELPETLDETYERTLQEINKADWELAYRLFQCIAVASRPLRVGELAEFLAFDFKAGPVPKFREDWCLEDPVEAVLSTCSTLISLLNVENSQVIQFSHYSVKEFLMSVRLAEKHDIISRRYHISATTAHTIIAQGCLGILLHLDQNANIESLTKFPLCEYAAENWVEHARFEGVSHNAEEGMKRLFDWRKPHLAVWLWIHDPTVPSWRQEKRAGGPLPPQGTPLHYASFCGLHDIVKVLAIERPQDVQSRGFTGDSTPLHLASQQGHVAVARILLEHGGDVAAKDGQGWTPLHRASEEGHVELTLFLVEHGADVAAKDGYGWTPLHRASERGDVELARILVQHGADASAQDEDGRAPLHQASERGDVELARFLVEHGADTAAQQIDGSTPLHWASEMGHVELARFLAEYGADVAAQENNGSTPLHRASFGGHLELAQILVEHGADAAAEDRTGWTPLHRACFGGHVELARFLVGHGAGVGVGDNYGWTPMHAAAEGGHVGIIPFLVEHGASVVARDEDGGTPLHAASWEGHVELSRWLVEHGSDVAATDKFGRTPLGFASIRGHMELWQYLHRLSADVAN